MCSPSVHDEVGGSSNSPIISSILPSDRALSPRLTHRIEMMAISDSIHAMVIPACQVNDNLPLLDPSPTSYAAVLFAPIVRRPSGSQSARTPPRRPDTPHPRRRRQESQELAILPQVPSCVLQKTNPEPKYSESYHSDTKREDYKHEIFLAWLNSCKEH